MAVAQSSAKSGRPLGADSTATYSLYDIVEIAFAAQNAAGVADDPVAEGYETCTEKTPGGGGGGGRVQRSRASVRGSPAWN